MNVMNYKCEICKICKKRVFGSGQLCRKCKKTVHAASFLSQGNLKDDRSEENVGGVDDSSEFLNDRPVVETVESDDDDESMEEVEEGMEEEEIDDEAEEDRISMFGDRDDESDDEDESMMSDGSVSSEIGERRGSRTVNSLVCCENCHMEALSIKSGCPVGEYDSLCRDVWYVPLTKVNFRVQKWKTVGKRNDHEHRHISRLALCGGCYWWLCESDKKTRMDHSYVWSQVWRVFFWLFLSNKVVHEKYGKEAWKYVPETVRPMWKNVVQRDFPTVYYNLDEIDACYKDATLELEKFEKVHAELKIGDIVKAYNGLMPNVLCPWGCSEYIYDCEELKFEHVFNELVWRCEWSELTSSEGMKSMSFRRDFLDGEPCVHLFNEKWKVMPSVAFLRDQGPCFLTCKIHGKGTCKRYFHLPRSPCRLVSSHGDQLGHVSLRSNVIGTVKAHKYSHEYQMNVCRGSYNGIDTCRINEERRFDIMSQSSEMLESVAVHERPDVRGLMSELVEAGKLSPNGERLMNEKANDYFDGQQEYLEKCKRGSTFMTLLDTVKLHRSRQAVKRREVLMHGVSSDGLPYSYSAEIEMKWPSVLVGIHEYDKHGCMPQVLRKLDQSKKHGLVDDRLLWTLEALLRRVPLFWETTCAAVKDWHEWHGHLLYRQKLNGTKRGGKAGKKYAFGILPFGIKDEKDLPLVGQMMKFLSRAVEYGRVRRGEVSGSVDFSNGFAPRQVKCLLEDEKHVETLSAIAAPRSVSRLVRDIKAVTSGKELVVVYRLENVVEVAYDLPLSVNGRDGDVFNLVFLSVSACKEVDGVGIKWVGEVYSRHEGMFEGFWVQKSLGKRCFQVNNVETVTKKRDFDIAVYVRASATSVDEIRKEYFSYVGGQERCRCKEHEMPLIACQRTKDKQCGKVDGLERQSECHRQCSYCCPIRGCEVAMCGSCYKETSDMNAVLVSAGRVRSWRMQTVDEDDCTDENDNDCDENNDDDESTCTVDSSYGSKASIGSGDLQMGGDVFADDLESVGNSGVETDDDVEGSNKKTGGIPCTIFGNKCATMTGSGRSGGSNIRGSVLLNQFGSCLVRSESQLNGTRSEKNLLQRLTLRDVGDTVAVAYPEAMMFPTIFWAPFGNGAEGSFLGSIPISLLCREGSRTDTGMAPILDHVKTRITSPLNIAGSHADYCSFMFDTVANSVLCTQDSRVVLRRGFAECLTAAGVRAKKRDENFYTDSVDNREVVNELCAAQRESKFTLFLTLTCNQAKHFGVRHVKHWIDNVECGFEAYKQWYKKQFPGQRDLNLDDRSDILKSLREQGRVLLLRNWMQVRKILRKYICESDERPLGKVILFFGRDEYQEEKGNLFHVHWLVATEDDYSTEEGQHKLEKLIRGFTAELIATDEIDDLVERGVLRDKSQVCEVQECALMVLKHDCSSVRNQLQTGESDKDVKCRCLHGERINKVQTRFYENVVDPKHSCEALKVLEWCGLIAPMSETNGSFRPLMEELVCKRIIPCCRREEGCISPVVPILFVVGWSSQNVQLLSYYSLARYVAKYVASIDQNNLIVFHADNRKAKSNAVRMEHVVQKNTKVTSSRMNEAKRMSSRRDAMHPTGRLICTFEQLQICLQEPQIQTNYESIKVSTTPLGERAGLVRTQPFGTKPEDLSKNGDITSPDLDDDHLEIVPYRDQQLPPFRRHSRSQKLVLRDQLHCPVTLDRVTLFGCRPPELMYVVRNPLLYWRWFVRSKAKAGTSPADLKYLLAPGKPLHESHLVDGLNYCVYVRSAAVAELWRHLQSVKGELYRHGHGAVYEWLNKFCELWCMNKVRGLNADESKFFDAVESRLVKEGEPTGNGNIYPLPIIVHSNIKPTNPHRFLIHMLLCYGNFDTEMDLYAHGSLRKCFEVAGVISCTANTAILEEEVKRLTRKWILDQLVYYPISTKTFDKYVTEACRVLKEAIIDDVVDIDEIPPALYTVLLATTSKESKEYVAESQKRLAKVTMEKLQPVFEKTGDAFPSMEDVLDGKAKNWPGVLSRTDGQSAESQEEQVNARNSVYRAIDDYMAMRTTAIKGNRGIVGAPGAGKTFCMQLGILYGLCRTLKCCTTAILAERAFLLGGWHFHRLFYLPVKPTCSVHRLAELAVINLLKRQNALDFLLQLDVLYMDEMGQVSAELLSVLDIIMRKIRRSSLFMGGILVIGTIDHLQLLPIEGHPFLVSPLVPFSFRFCKLQHSVRGSCDPAMLRVVDITRLVSDNFTLEVANELRTLLGDNCTFVTSWDDPAITDDALRVFGKHLPAIDETKRFLAMKEDELHNRGEDSVNVRAEDTMISIESHGEWQRASTWVTTTLNKKTSEPEELMLFAGAFYEFTYNSPGHFSATQLALLSRVPTQSITDAFQEIEIWAAPAGTRDATLPSYDDATLLAHKWTLQKVGTAPEYERVDYGRKVRMKRRQYGLRHHIASTIHAAIGHTVPKIAARLDLPAYRLWERAQAVVLVTRTGKLSDIIFVGDKDNNIQAIIDAFSLKDQWTDYMISLVDILSCAGPSPVLQQGILHPYRPRDVDLPRAGVGVVYMLCSGSNTRRTYVGETQDIKERIRKHNSRDGGSCGTRHAHGKPWQLIGYICGFRDKNSRRAFEKRLQTLRNQRFRRSNARAATRLMDTAAELAASWVDDSLHVTSLLPKL